MREYLYCIHGVTLRLTADSRAIASAVQTLLHHFHQETLEDSISLELLFRGVHNRTEIPISVSPSAQVLLSRKEKTVGDPLHPAWRCTLYRDSNRTVVDYHEQGILLIDSQQGRAEGYLVEPDAMHPDLLGTLFHLTLIELLKRKGLYTIHAAALEKEGCGLLILGESRRGKTTCCISLLRAGYQCLSDDYPLLRENGTKLELLSFPMKIGVTEETIEFFPELRAAKGLYQGFHKSYFYIEDLFPHGKADSCEPVLIIFPRIIDWPESQMQPLPKSRALEEFLHQNILVLDKDVAKRQFQAFSRLVEKAACYRLYFGKDVLNLSQIIDPVLEKG